MTEHDDALSLDMVTAALRADSTDVAIYARVLTQSLGEALPSEFVTVDRDRTMSDRMRGRPGEVSKVAVVVGPTLPSAGTSSADVVSDLPKHAALGQSDQGSGDQPEDATLVRRSAIRPVCE